MANGEQQWATGVIRGLGLKPNQRNVSNLIGWAKAEGGHTHNDARYNYLNTTQPMPGAGNTGTQGNIKVYRSLRQGIDATVRTLRNGRYGSIIRSLDASPQQLAQAIDSSPWGTHNPQLASIIAGGKGTPSYGSSSAQGTAPSAPAPGGDGLDSDLQARRQLLLGYLAERDNPDAMLRLATGLAQLRSELDSLRSGGSQDAVAPGTPLRPKAPSASTSQKGVVNFEGKKVAAWIAPALSYARKHGWKGQVNSGYRSFADQTRIYNSGVRPAAKPGTSNHEGSDYPRGAIDVSDAQQLSQILKRSPYASRLVWAGSKDPVHFSHPHNGSY